MGITVGIASANEYSSLAAAIASIGSTEMMLIIPYAQSVSADLTIPANIRLWFTNGTINVASGKKLKVNGPITAGVRQIFTGTGGVKFGSANPIAFPEWFGAAADGATNDWAAIQKAINAFAP